MRTGRLADDERGFSEGFAVGVLIAITVLMTLSVGIYVIAVDVEEGPPSANFSYDYNADADTLLIRYSRGENFTSGEVILESGTTAASWAELAGTGPNATLAPGGAIQLSASGRWGQVITDGTQVSIHHQRNANRTRLSNWTASP